MDHTSTGAAPVKTGKADRRADLPFLVITLTLLGIGVVMVLSASFASAYYDLQGETGHNPVYFFSRQAIFAAHRLARPDARLPRLRSAAAARFRRKPCGGPRHRHGCKRRKTMDKPWLHDVPAVRNYKNRNYSLLFGADMQI